MAAKRGKEHADAFINDLVNSNFNNIRGIDNNGAAQTNTIALKSALDSIRDSSDIYSVIGYDMNKYKSSPSVKKAKDENQKEEALRSTLVEAQDMVHQSPILILIIHYSFITSDSLVLF